ncbi:hypothetical protein ACFCYI_13745 [Streptomyces sp. NPDC056257]|uniref:hypothetical protein n=1 Tax=unclassified Streptomyces TaxID=2593676 RepID=UPI0035DEC4A6
MSLIKTYRSHTLAAAGLALAATALLAPTASAAPVTGTSSAAVSVSEASQAKFGIQKLWHATVQCQIVRISDNNVVGYDRADGTGNTEQAAVTDAARNIPVPSGHYKRHCDTKRIW